MVGQTRKTGYTVPCLEGNGRARCVASSKACGPGKVPESTIAGSNKDEGHQARYTSKL